MSKTVLIVDNMPVMRMILSKLAAEIGFEVAAEATNSMEALDSYSKNLPDVVIMDINEPAIEGISTIKAIIATHPDAVIIMCSALGQKSIIVDSIKAGAKDFIVKPFQKQKILETLAKYL